MTTKFNRELALQLAIAKKERSAVTIRRETELEQRARLSKGVAEVMAFRDVCYAKQVHGVVLVSQDW